MATTRRSMKSTIQGALDDIVSVNTSSSRRTRCLAVLEQQLALACAPNVEDDTMSIFLELQDTFECNVPSRALSWIQTVIPRIESLVSGKSSTDTDRESELNTICAQLYQLLSIVQGIALHHESSKAFLGRRYSLEMLTALLTTSRHTPMIDQGPDAGNSSTGLTSDKTSSVAHLSSAVLDSLLCILVDSSPALRTFEEVNGVQAIVKILKRAGTPREVRMKCLEFLYFYLMDETGAHGPATVPISQSTPSSPISTQPSTPLLKPGLKIFPRPPSGISSLSITSSSSSSSSTGSSTSLSSISSISSVTTTGTTHTSTSSLRAPSPVKKSYSASALPPDPHTPPGSPPPGSDFAKPMTRAVQSRSMFLLRKEVDYEPQSPKKIQISSLGVGGGHSASRLRDRATGRSEHSGGSSSSLRQVDVADNSGADYERGGSKHERVRTTDEKKEILGTMLGNVDALVEGVRRAGIWGLS